MLSPSVPKRFRDTITHSPTSPCLFLQILKISVRGHTF
ncbi:UNVERIFIED_ORG: hypothetical protein QOE_2791 [Clostridioides difficile F501]